MTKDPATPAELVAALDQVTAQARHLTRRGRAAFCADDLDGQVARLAACQVVIQLQAVIDDLPPAALDTLADLPLHAVRGMRNRLAHGYGDTDPALLWQTMAVTLPELTATVRRVLADLPG